MFMMILLLMTAISSASAVDRLYFEKSGITSGETDMIEFSLENTQDMFGFQADIDLPEGLEFIKIDGNPDIRMSSRADGCDCKIVSNSISPRRIRIGVFSSNHNPYTGNDGVLFCIGVKASENFAGGTVTVTNVRFVDKEDRDIIFPDFSAAVNAIISATLIKLSVTEWSGKIGEKILLTATVLPENTTDKSVTWTSSNEAVATVDANGNVTAIGLGNADITATCGEVSATCTVTVVPTPVMSVTLSNTSLNLTEGETATLTATIAPENATDKSVTWTSSDASIASVSAEGVVTAIKAGTATITATSANIKTATCTVTVAANIISVESIEISKTELSLTEGDTATLTATIAPENATDKTVTWTSSDEAVATVSADGVVTAVKAGTATITAASSNGKTASCVVTVAAKIYEVTGITLSITELSMTEGDTTTLTATIAPENATDKSVTWTSSDEAVATVSADGVVTAVKAGTATITVASSNGKTATCKVTVAAKIIEVTGITLSKTELSMTEGDTESLTATIAPENATDKSVTWTSSDEAVATVSADGVVTAVKAGTATITVASSNGKTATCKVTVAAKIIEVTGITLSNTNINLTEGETATITATITPENATDKSVKWTSSEESVATVSSDGKVTAVGCGTAVITVSSTDGSGVKSECNVTVTAKFIPVTSITLSATEWEGREGDQLTLKATVLPEDATDKTILWSSSNESVATVSSKGIITAVGVGYTIITASASDGSGITASMFVRVSSNVPQEFTVTYNFGEPIGLTPAQQVEPTNDPVCEVDGVIFTANNISLVASGGNTTPRLWSNSSKGVQLRVYNGGQITVSTENGLAEISSIEIVGQQLDALTINGEIFSNQSEIKYVLTTTTNSLTINCMTHGSHKRADISYINVNCQRESGSFEDIKAQELHFDKDEIILKVGDEYHVQAIILPENTTNKLLEWSSDAPNIVSVGIDGRVLARKPGVAKISAKTLDGSNLMTSLEVTVLPTLAEFLSINPTVWSGEEGGEFTIVATVLPDNTDDKNVTFVSSDTTVATVDANGNVKVLKEGACIITVSTVDGSNLSAECVITGLSGVESILAVPEACVDVYDMNGVLLKHHCSHEDLKRLKPAVYILRSGNTVVKAVVK